MICQTIGCKNEQLKDFSCCQQCFDSVIDSVDYGVKNKDLKLSKGRKMSIPDKLDEIENELSLYRENMKGFMSANTEIEKTLMKMVELNNNLIKSNEKMIAGLDKRITKIESQVIHLGGL